MVGIGDGGNCRTPTSSCHNSSSLQGPGFAAQRGNTQSALGHGAFRTLRWRKLANGSSRTLRAMQVRTWMMIRCQSPNLSRLAILIWLRDACPT